MSEIEKLYENAGIEYEERYNNCTLNKEGDCELKCSCDICKYSEEKYIYPPFTAEKQIELIKFLFNHNVYYDVDEKGNYWFHINDDCYTYHYNKFEIALANIINEMWQDLTEKEKAEIKRILE